MSLWRGSVIVLVLLSAAGCPQTVAPGEIALPGFSTATRKAIERLLRDHGRGASGRGERRPPVATLDWDNTMVRPDIGDLALFYALANDRLLAPTSWSTLDPSLSPPAVARLEEACRGAGAPGEPLATATDPGCTDVILSIYLEGQLPDGAVAFGQPDTPSIQRTYLFGARLWQGKTPSEVRDVAAAAWRWGTDQPVGATVRLGSRAVPSWIRLQPPMVDLVHALHSQGVEVWIVSASEQHLVEATAAHAGIPRERVLGVQMALDAHGRLSPALVPCGADGVERMSFGEGKRCVINRTVFGIPPERQAELAAPLLRAVLAAGDSDGDVPMLQDATEVRLALDRNRSELMCRALFNEDGRWFVEPLFVEPLPPRAEPYACRAYRDAAGRPLPDQDSRRIAHP